MSNLNVHNITLGSGADQRGKAEIGTDGDVPGQLAIKRGKAGGTSEKVLAITPDGGVILPSAPDMPAAPQDVIIQRVLARVMPRVVPSASGKRSFVKKGAKAVSIKAGTIVFVGGMAKAYSVDTPVAMPDVMTPGEDYGIWVLPLGGLFAAKDGANAPYYPSAAQAGAAKLGGFHYGLVDPGAVLADAGFNTAEKASKDMVWKQSNVDLLAGINAHSLWDEAFRPLCDPRGMACVSDDTGRGLFWFDLYFTGTQHVTNGTSRAGTDVASGAVQPVIPAMFGGNGTAKYTSLNWYEANEIAQSHSKRAMSYQEFAAAAFGVTESQSIGGAASTIPLTKREAGYTSKWGGEQMTGHLWSWGAAAHAAGGTAWVAGALRGQSFGTPYAVLLGGSRPYAGNSGSRSTYWNYTAWAANMDVGFRAACDHQRPQ